MDNETYEYVASFTCASVGRFEVRYFAKDRNDAFVKAELLATPLAIIAAKLDTVVMFVPDINIDQMLHDLNNR